VVSLLLDHVERAIELHVDLTAVVARDLDLVIALLVADLAAGDLATAGGLERRGTGLVERRTGDALVATGAVFAAAGRAGDCRAAYPQGRDGPRGDDDALQLVPPG
jgi:hypothetical protein